MVNHYEGHAEITTKNKLFKNITKYQDEQGENVFKNVLPLTFCLKVPVAPTGEVDQKLLNHELKAFKQAYRLLDKFQEAIKEVDYTQKSSTTFGDDQ